ncbi:MAG: 3'-5' exonuclease domain-containing protein 2 [Bacteroidaceae bacterium]|nr:3'-5' exonuclease domain-containing protein 2 [Bacteroidaceae bacterium]
MKKLYNKFDKKVLAALPRVLFEGRIVVVLTEGEADKAVDYLLGFPCVGIDTETRPTFKRGGMNPVALLQVSTPDTCFLFRLNRFGLPESIVRLMTSESTRKIGLSLNDDFSQLRKRKDFKPVNYVELQEYVKPFGIKDLSLQKLYANFFGQKISKNQCLTNWEADVLTEAQQRYAATDAWSCLKLYDVMSELLSSHDYQLIQVPEPETTNS